MSYNQWEVWLARVRFEDSPEVKNRPVLIMGENGPVVIAIKMTSTAPRIREYQLAQWSFAGLNKPTTVRLEKILHLRGADFVHRIGRIHPMDIVEIQQRLCKHT